ncbi:MULTISPECIES: helix-turn-helix domain-containing protein [unclassified Streptomyces]|uniref:Helix-turn-helix domain-containing protein n=1 Tax=Streptomyces sp. NBC_00060 TaxID=2975636 RepID=A0AAU2HE28_9ACTN
MALQHLSAPSRATSPVPGGTPRSGVIHVNTRHTSRYTVVGNHLAQHRGLSLVAIGLAVHIQSLPAGARISIKTLADRFPEGETRIAAALRELEAYGYLERTRERLPSGRVVTRTVSYNQPGARAEAATPPAPEVSKAPARATTPADVRPTPAPPASLPGTHAPQLPHPAADLLADLRRHDPRLLLSERDVHRLAPDVAAWLERGAAPDAVRRTLTANLPEPLRHPTALLAHRLTTLLPPPLPAPRAIARPDPLQTCEDCDRAFRDTGPGRCRDCRTAALEAA